MSSVETYCALFAQMRCIKLVIWTAYNGKPVLPVCRSDLGVGAALTAAVSALLLPCLPTFLACLGTSLLYMWRLAPYELDNGGFLDFLSFVRPTHSSRTPAALCTRARLSRRVHNHIRASFAPLRIGPHCPG